MTVPAQPSPPRQQEEAGTCRRVVDLETNEECGEPGESKVKLVDASGSYYVTLCSIHRRHHDKQFALRRLSRKSS